MTDRTIDSPALEDQGLEGIAGRYSQAFPSADVNSFRAHLAVVRSGARLSQAVGQYLNARFGLNSARYSLLRALYFTDGHRLPQSEVARAMNVTSPNVTQLIDALEREGLVERAISESDRRVTYAQLTREGENRCAELIPAMARFMQETMAPLSSEEMAQLTSLLDRFRANLAQMKDIET
jgi:MarR family transcriptional regulator, 2-MHQ and catechol-resistance regulon repressor